MDMLTFFQTVIPSDGVKFIAEFVALPDHPRGGVFMHYPANTAEELVTIVTKLARRGNTIYHACASYQEVIYKVSPKGRQYPAGRQKSNALSAKAIWQDFDVGKYDNNGQLKSISYATRTEALAAIKHFMVETGFPRPLLVSSGNGFHAYWPFTEAIPADEWLQLANQVRAAFTHAGVKFDSARDTDIASILRPVGTFNNGKPVEVLRTQEPREARFYQDLLRAYLDKHDIAAEPVRSTKSDNEFAGDPAEFPPASLELAATRCGQLQDFRDTGGSSEPLWYAYLGVAKHCTDGTTLVHEWGKAYAGYSAAETQNKLNQWSYGPTKCDMFKKLNGARCTQCAFAGTISSPIQLGYDLHTNAPVVEADDSSGAEGQHEIPYWPKGFRVTPSGVMQMMVPDKDTNVPVAVTVASPLFYLAERIQLDDGTYAYTINMEVRKGIWRTFDMPAKNMADLRAFKSVLASYEVIVSNEKLVTLFANEMATSLRKHKDEINTFRQFGWIPGNKGFLIGDTLVTAEGRQKVRVSTEVVKAPLLLSSGDTRGDKGTWARGVDTLYNRPNGEPYQYAICTQFGAPLVPLMDFEEWNGIPMALTSNVSGLGKSTVCKIGINALAKSNVTTVADATAKAIIGRASVMNNLPVLFDEITSSLKDPIDLGDTLYALSNGRPRIGMTADGRERAPSPPFKLNSSITGNKNIMFQLTETKNNPEALQMRVFEIALDDYPILDTMGRDSELHAVHHELALNLVNSHHGVWADDYIRFVIENQVEIVAKLRSVAGKILKALGSGAAKERFYAFHVACTLVGGSIARKLGALNFDLTALRKWALNHILLMRRNAIMLSGTVEDELSSLLTDLHGHILVTRNYDRLNNTTNTEVPMLGLRGDIKARLVLGTDKERPQLYVAIKAIEEWCIKNDKVPMKFRRELANHGLLRAGGDQGGGFDKKISLGRGVPSYPSGRCRCIEIDYAVATGYVEDFVYGFANVEPIRGSATKSATSEIENLEPEAVTA